LAETALLASISATNHASKRCYSHIAIVNQIYQ